MSLNNRAVAHTPSRGITCMFCGRWPATLYRDLNEKIGPRVCEFCIEEGRVVRNANGIYVSRPEEPAQPAGSPDSDSHSSSPRSDAPDSAA